MKIFKILNVLIIAILIATSSCSKDDDLQQISVSENEVLKFTASKNQGGKVLYSEWIPSGLPNSSLSGAEFFDLPLIEKKFFDSNKDLIIFYGKRNSVSQLPVTIPISSESYMVELAPVTKGTIPRVRVTSLNWSTEALQDIFFRPDKKAQFRVVIIPGNELLKLDSYNPSLIEKMNYEELTTYLGISN